MTRTVTGIRMNTEQTIENLEVLENEYDEEIIDEVLYDELQYSED